MNDFMAEEPRSTRPLQVPPQTALWHRLRPTVAERKYAVTSEELGRNSF